MINYAVVKTKKDLKRAVEGNVDQIIVINSRLASNIKVVKATSKSALVVAVCSVLVTATNFWNPVGWGAGAVGVAVSSSVVTAITVLGVSAAVIYAIHSDYTIEGKTKIKTGDGTEYEGEIILRKKS